MVCMPATSSALPRARLVRTPRRGLSVKLAAAINHAHQMLDGVPQAVQQLQSTNHVYAALRRTQGGIVQLAAEQLRLEAASVPSVDGDLHVASPDGGLGAAVQALSGPGVRWLSASTLAAPAREFGATIVTGFSDATSDAPHFMLEHTMGAGEVRMVVTLWPRRDWMVNQDYLQSYFGSAPPGSQRSYNDIYNSVMNTPGWRRFQSPALVVKPMLSTAMAYTYEPTEDNLRMACETAAEVAQLWVNFLKQKQGSIQQIADAELRKYDARYIQSVAEDPDAPKPDGIFGKETATKLMAMMHGSVEAAGLKG